MIDILSELEVNLKGLPLDVSGGLNIKMNNDYSRIET